MLKCGMSEVNITPTIGSDIPGQIYVRKSSGIKDELFVKAMVVENSNDIIAIVAVDALGIPRQDVLMIRELVSDKTGIPKKNIMVSATHSHTGPSVASIYGSSRDDSYMEYMVKKASDAVLLAFNRRGPVKIGFGTGKEEGIAFNRRFLMKDGTVKTNAGFGNPEIERPTGPVDPDVAVIRIDDMQNRPVGVLTSFACHLDTVGGTEYCADYPGELSCTLKKVLGYDVVSIFLTGACGNINHFDVSGGFKLHEENYKQMGRILAGEVLKTREKICVDVDMVLAARSIAFDIATRKPSQDEISNTESLEISKTADSREKFFARQMLEYVKCRKEKVQTEVQVITMGNMAITGFPGEMFVEFGLDLKSKSPYKYNIINELANDCAGYVTTREAIEQGGYEPRLTGYTNLVPDAGYEMVEYALHMLKHMG